MQAVLSKKCEPIFERIVCIQENFFIYEIIEYIYENFPFDKMKSGMEWNQVFRKMEQ